MRRAPRLARDGVVVAELARPAARGQLLESRRHLGGGVHDAQHAQLVPALGVGLKIVISGQEVK